jgi:hypothetical protein
MKKAKLQGMDVSVGVYAGVLVGEGAIVDEGVGERVGSFGVGEANKATRVNSAATVLAACVKAALEEAGVSCPLGKLHPTIVMINIKVRPK